MNNVEFTDEKDNKDNLFEEPKTPNMVRWVMKTGLVKDERQANIALIVIAVMFFVLTWVFIAGGNNTTPQATYLEDIPVDVLETIPPEILETIPTRN